VWKHARALEGQLIPTPVPADFHSEAIEWIGLLKSVRSATDQYVAMEFGAGFGPWVVAGGIAAKSRGINKIRLYAVEGDSQHFQFLRQHLSDNGFEPDQHMLIEAAVGFKAGVAEWPVLEDSLASEEWGCRPMEATLDYTGRQFQKTKQIRVVPALDLVMKEPCWDLIHIDVQGEEVSICRSCIDELNARVRRIVVGTHSRKIDGDLLELMCRAGWILEHEKPAKFTFVPNPTTLEAMTTVDGTQVWRNPRLLQEADRLSSFSQEITSPANELRMSAGGACTVSINVKNTGTQPWFGSSAVWPVRASYRWFDTNGNALPIEGNRALLSRPVIQPGESDMVQLQISAPPYSGLYTVAISMVQEGVAWFLDRGADPLVLTAKIE
jgi:FkbM family methyltransferase